MRTEETELKLCPFCGGEARFETYGGTACTVVCQTCQCGTSTVCPECSDRLAEACEELWKEKENER